MAAFLPSFFKFPICPSSVCGGGGAKECDTRGDASESRKGRFKRPSLLRNSMDSITGIFRDGFFPACCSGSLALRVGLARLPGLDLREHHKKEKYDSIQIFTRSSRNETKLGMSS